MVAGPAVGDAVTRARRLPGLAVGLHLDLVDGLPALPRTEVPDLVGGDGRFDRNMTRAGFRFFFLPRVRRQLAMEIRAQFDAFRATGLRLDHVNAHKHMHVHPTIARMIIDIGRDYRMAAVRVPFEPVEPLRAAFPEEHYAAPFYRPWIGRLRGRLRAAGLLVNDNVFGLAWSGGFDETRLLRLIPHLPDGISEIYLHPASKSSAVLEAAMPGYRRAEEFAALLNPAVKGRLAEFGVTLASYGDFQSAGARM